MSNSVAAEEAFRFLNAGTRMLYRGQGDTPTAARDRASNNAGITRAEGERVWKRWRDMKHPNGDVYRLLRNAYGHLCEAVEAKAAAIEREAQQIEEDNEINRRSQASVARVAAPSQGKEEQVK